MISPLKTICRFNLRALLLALLVHVPLSYGFDLLGMVGLGGDSGSGKVAHLESRLKDGFFVTAIVWSPDGRFIASTGMDTHLLHIWDVAQRKLVKELQFPHAPGPYVHTLAWSPDGHSLAGCNSFGNGLRIFDTRDWHVVKDFSGEVACALPRFSSDGLELGVVGGPLGGTGMVTTLATSNWQVTKIVKLPHLPYGAGRGGSAQWEDIAYVPGTHTIAIGGGRYEPDNGDPCAKPLGPNTGRPYTGRVWLLEAEDKDFSRSVGVYCSPKGAAVTFLVFEPKGKQFTTSTQTGNWVTDSVHTMGYPDGKLLSAPFDNTNAGTSRALSYTPDGKYLLAGLNQPPFKASPLEIINAQTGEVVDAVHVPNHVQDIAVHPQSTAFAAASSDGILIWKFKTK